MEDKKGRISKEGMRVSCEDQAAGSNPASGFCCVCGHRLSSHIDEQEWWRCHSLDAAAYQCECRLLKEDNWGKNQLSDFDLGTRIERSRKELGLG